MAWILLILALIELVTFLDLHTRDHKRLNRRRFDPETWR